MAESEEMMQQLRSKATDHLLREEYEESASLYSQFISLCQHRENPDSKLQKSLCLALSNRAEARFRLREFSVALRDCDEALKLDCAHFKTLLCKGKILMSLSRYAAALACFREAELGAPGSDTLHGCLEKCRKMELLSRTGAFDLSDWIAGKFTGSPPELAEYVGPVEVRRSEISGRGLFAAKTVEAGTLLFVTKVVAVERSILGSEDLVENAQLILWKNFIDKIINSCSKCQLIARFINTLSCGENESDLDVPAMSLFRPDGDIDCDFTGFSPEGLEKSRVLSILDVNSLVEDSVSGKVLGKNRDYYGIGLWILAGFMNHSCAPNARRLHVGDYAMVHASRDVKAGEELTFAYFDALTPLAKRREMAAGWGFECRCERCRFEGSFSGVEGAVLGREKGFVRASRWEALAEAHRSGKRKHVGALESVAEAVGGDERVLRVLLRDGAGAGEGGGGGGGGDERVGGVWRGGGAGAGTESALRVGRGVYGKAVRKKQALKALLDGLLVTHHHSLLP